MKLTVYTPGSHRGQRYNPGPEGIELDVTEDQAAFLHRQGATTRPGSAKPAEAAPEVAPARPKPRFAIGKHTGKDTPQD